MSTDFGLSKKVSAGDLFGGRLEKFGVREHVTPDTSERHRLLTDGRNYLHVYITDDGFVSSLTMYGANAPGKILSAIGEAFDTVIFSEYQAQFWGFARAFDVAQIYPPTTTAARRSRASPIRHL